MRVDASNPSSYRKQMSSVAEDWQADAWRYLEAVGELQYVISWRSSACGRCRMIPSTIDDQGEATGDLPDDDPNADTVRAIASAIGGGVSGQSKIIERASYLLSVVGECWGAMLVRDPAREEMTDGSPLPVDLSRPGFQTEQWFIFGREQIFQTVNGIQLKLPDGSRHNVNPKVDILFRIWDEHPRDPSKPISMIWSNRVVLNGIVKADATIDAAANNRLIGNGIMFVPQEMSLPDQQQAPVAIPVGDSDTLDPVPYFEPNAAQKLQDLLYDVASTATRDPKSQAAMLPLIAGVPGDMIKNVAWIRPGSDIPETTLKLQESDIRRLAMGLMVDPARLFGMSEGNHWSAWNIDENDVKVHVAPLLSIIAAAFNQEVFREKLTLEGIDPDRYLLWYDTNPLSQDPDKTEEANAAFDRGAISGAALRHHLGFDDDDGYDYTKIDGWVEMALDKMAANPANTAQLLPILEAAARKVGLDIAPPPPTALPPGQQPTEQPPNSGQQPDESTQTSSPQPAPIQAAAMTVARLCVNRALELANKRRRTRADFALYRDVPIELAHTKLPPIRNAEAAGFIEGWDTGLSDTDLAQLGLVPESFRDMVEGVAMLAQVTSSPPLITQTMLRRAA